MSIKRRVIVGKLLEKGHNDLVNAMAGGGSSFESFRRAKSADLPMNDEDKAFVEDIKSKSVDELTKMMNNYKVNQWHNLFPSGWPRHWGPYPKNLAEALIKSEARDPFGDIANLYYAGRKADPAAIAIWRKDLLEGGFRGNMIDQIGYGRWGEMLTHERPLLKKMLLAMTDKEISYVIKMVTEYEDPEGLDELLKEVRGSDDE